jgi:hypothetical protein
MPTTQSVINSNLAALGFSNPSQTGLFAKIAEALGLIVDNTLTEFTNTETAITATITAKNYGKSGYYTAYALAFQYGDSLSIDANGNYYYPVIDTTKQIISQAAFYASSGGDLFLKVASKDITGNTIPLTLTQYNAFVAYMKNFEIAGLPVNYISANPNILYFVATCTYYSSYDLPTLQTNINTYLTLFMNSFAFNGTFYVDDLSNYIMANVAGVRSFFINQTSVDGVPFSGSVQLNAGYFNYNSAIPSNIVYNGI